jgi:hypothetical protein
MKNLLCLVYRGVRRMNYISRRRDAVPPSPLNGERAGVRGEEIPHRSIARGYCAGQSPSPHPTLSPPSRERRGNVPGRSLAYPTVSSIDRLRLQILSSQGLVSSKRSNHHASVIAVVSNCLPTAIAAERFRAVLTYLTLMERAGIDRRNGDRNEWKRKPPVTERHSRWFISLPRGFACGCSRPGRTGSA